MRPAPTARAGQGGMALVSAIFLLVVLAALGVFAVRINGVQQQTVTAALRASQAMSAARSGVSWATYRALNAGWCGNATLSLTEAATAGFDVDIECSETVHTEGASTVTVFIIDVLSQAGTYGGPDYVSRRLEVKVTNAT